MSRLKGYAWFNLVVVTAALGLVLSLVLTSGPGAALAGFFPLGLIGFFQLFIQKLPWHPDALSEKDRQALAGSRPRAMKLFAALFLPMCAVIWALLFLKKSDELFLLLSGYVGLGGLAFCWFAQAVAILTWRGEVKPDA